LLPAFLQDRDDIDAAASAETHDEQLHRAGAEACAALLDARVHVDGIATVVRPDKMKSVIDAFDVDSHSPRKIKKSDSGGMG
jgi:hypothetical protein